MAISEELISASDESMTRARGGPLAVRPRMRSRLSRGASGFTFIELLVVTTILLILASAVMPLAKVTVQRQREAELRRSLREMRTAIDKYKEAVDNGLIGSIDVKAGSEGYPPDLDTLVAGGTVADEPRRRQQEVLQRGARASS